MSEPAPTDEGPKGHVVRRILRRFVSADSYGFVLVLIVASYVLSVSVASDWGASAVVFIQIGTVWFALRTSHARRPVRRAAFVLMVIAGSVALVNLAEPDGARRFLFALGSLLYFIAPFSIIRHLVSRPTVDAETMLGAISAYLLFGMFYAFFYFEIFDDPAADRLLRRADEAGRHPAGAVLQLHDPDDDRLREPGPGAEPRADACRGEMILGQLFLITALGKIVTAWRPARWSHSDPAD